MRTIHGRNREEGQAYECFCEQKAATGLARLPFNQALYNTFEDEITSLLFVVGSVGV